MPPSDRSDVLNRLLRIVSRSLPAYLAEARPWDPPQSTELSAALQNLALDEADYAQRLGELICRRHARPEPGGFPTAFTDVHDLSVEYLARQITDSLPADMQAVQECLAPLADDPQAREMAEEILGNLRGHREILEAAMKAFSGA